MVALYSNGATAVMTSTRAPKSSPLRGSLRLTTLSQSFTCVLKTSDYSEVNCKLNITGSGRPNEEGCEAVSSGCHAVNANPRVGADTGVRLRRGSDYALSSNILKVSVKQGWSDKNSTEQRNPGNVWRV